VFGMKNAEGFFPSLPARNERGESWREGKLTKNGLLSPALSSFFGEEREKGIAAAVQANYLPNTIGWKPAIQQVWKPALRPKGAKQIPMRGAVGHSTHRFHFGNLFWQLL